MNHNIVIDNEGNEHQAAYSNRGINGCHSCSLQDINCKFAPCTASERKDHTHAIYKRKIKIGDIKR